MVSQWSDGSTSHPATPLPSLTAPNRLWVHAWAILSGPSAAAQATLLRGIVTSCKGLARSAWGTEEGP